MTPTRTIQSDDSIIQQVGTWAAVNDAAASGGRYVVNTGEASLTVSFSGTVLEVIYLAGPDYGTLAVEVDGALLRTVDTSGPAQTNQRAQFNYLSPTDHLLRVYAVNGATIAVDAFVVENVLPASSRMAEDVGGLGGPHDPQLVVPLFDPFGTDGSFYGSDVDIDGNVAVMGAPGATSSVYEGVVYVAFRNNGIWSAETTLVSPNPSNSHFGHSVAIDGNFAIVGAPSEELSDGRIYIFERDPVLRTWTQRYQFSPNIQGQQFGYSVAIDGNIAVVGTDPYLSTSQEIVYIFRNNFGTWVLEQQVQSPQSGTLGGFGEAVAISGDYLVVGASNEQDATQGIRGGAAHVFRYNGGSDWVLDGTVSNPSPLSDQHFGWSVAIDNLRMLVGEPNDSTVTEDSGAAHLYERRNGTWQYQQTFTTTVPLPSFRRFGYDVALHGDLITIGSYPDVENATDRAGSATIYQRSGPNWIFQSQMVSPLANDSSFGAAIAIKGFDLIVGAPMSTPLSVDAAGAAYIYDLSLTSEPGSPLLDEAVPSQTGTFSITIPTAPQNGAVVFDISTDGQCSVSPTTVVFSSAGSQNVTVAVINDDVAEDPSYRCVITSRVNVLASSDEYDTTPDQITTATIVDNDAPATGLEPATNVVVTPTSPTRIEVMWTDNTVKESGFRVDRSVNGGPYLEIATVNPNTTQYSDGSVTCGQIYSYRIRTDRDGLVAASSAAATQTQCAPEFVADVGRGVPARAGNCSRTNTRLQITTTDMLRTRAYNIRYVFDDGDLPATYYRTRTYTATVKNATASLVLYPALRDDYGVGVDTVDTMPNPIFLRIEMESAVGGPSTCQRLEVQYSCSTGVATVIAEGNDCSAFPN